MSSVGHDGRQTPHRIECYAYLIIAFLTLFISNDLRADTRIDYRPIRAANQCLPDAVGFQMALQVQYPGTWSRILRLDWNVKQNGRPLAHAYCIYVLNNKLYAYDSQGGQRQLDINVAAKYQASVLGRYLGKRYYGTASYLPAFDPSRLASAR